jgi:hypothetical protein
VNPTVDDVRVEIYRSFIEDNRAPTAAEIATRSNQSVAEVEGALSQLDRDGVIALYPDTRSVWLAHPFAAAESSFAVLTPRGKWDAICIWDALGILVVLGSDGAVETTCPDCGDALTLSVRDGEIDSSEYVVHYEVPAARFYDDIAHT